MPTRLECAARLKQLMRFTSHENEIEAYMGIYRNSTWVYDTPDGRKYARVVEGDGAVAYPCDLIDTTIPDTYTQAIWIKRLPEGRWGIIRRRIEGY